ncbi:MAG: hypothetical protein QMD05_11145, partial [Candidatus Brocadiaceae bacterium]|nr:hypothetical protein [Candidatus Brocadiaceae bacterium]
MKKLLIAMALVVLWATPTLADLRVTPVDKQVGTKDANEQIYEWRSDDRLYPYDYSEGANVNF